MTFRSSRKWALRWCTNFGKWALVFRWLENFEHRRGKAMAKTGLVVSAHPGDFVWRAGGAIALHAKKGYRVKIVCLAFGERGESQFAWKQPGMTLEKVKAGRRDEAEARRRFPRCRDRIL